MSNHETQLNAKRIATDSEAYERCDAAKDGKGLTFTAQAEQQTA